MCAKWKEATGPGSIYIKRLGRQLIRQESKAGLGSDKSATPAILQVETGQPSQLSEPI